MKAMAPEIPARYQRAADVLDAVLAARDSRPIASRTTPAAQRGAARPDVARGVRPRSMAPDRSTSMTSRHGSRPAKHPRPGSAGTATRPCMRGPISVRSAARHSDHDAASFAGVKRFISADSRAVWLDAPMQDN